MIHEPTNQPNSYSTNQPLTQPTNQPLTQPTNQPTNQPLAQPTNQPVNQKIKFNWSRLSKLRDFLLLNVETKNKDDDKLHQLVRTGFYVLPNGTWTVNAGMRVLLLV
jgi:hypothetical protein